MTLDDYSSRAAACGRCADFLESRPGAAGHEALADAWLAQKLRTEAESWELLANSPVAAVVDHGGSSQPFLPLPKRVGKPLTGRMVESLVEMKRGAKVESEEFFSWPRWKHDLGARHMSIGCPTRAMLEGLHDRGLLSVSKVGRRWLTTINEAGQAALLAHEQAKRNKKPSPFKGSGTSYAVTD